MGMGNHGNSYEWNGANVQQHPQGSQPLSIDTGLSNARSVPTTPASTPPGAVPQGIAYGAAQSYDGSRPMYSAPPTQSSQYAQGQPLMNYRPDGTYSKTEMAPPSRIGEIPDEGEVKPPEGILPQNNDQAAAPPAGPEGDHEHDNEYTHSSAPYNGNRVSYGYSASGNSGPMHPDHAHLSPDMTGSPHQNGSGRATPRTATNGPTQWASGYPTPQRQTAPSSNLYTVMSDPRSAPNGSATHDAYPGSGAVPQYASQGYASTNGLSSTGKRGRDEEEVQEAYRPDSVQSDDTAGLKRRKTMEGGAVGPTYAQDPSPGLQRAHTMTAQRARR